MKAKTVNEDIYSNSRMNISDFHNWFYDIIENPEYDLIDYDDWKWIIATLVNDEYSSDEELKEYFLDEYEGFKNNEELLDELISKREYFLDFRYVKDLDIV
jgi:hypothetical protein